MRCEDFENKLNEALDERRPPAVADELATHASGCPACDALWRGYEGLLTAIGALKAPATPVDLTARVMAEYTAARRAPRRRLALAAVALAASVVVALGLGLFRGTNAPDVAVDLAGDDASAVAIVSPSAVNPLVASRPALFDQVQETYLPLWTATGESMTSVLDALPVGTGESPNRVAPSFAGDLRAVPDEAEVAGGLAPVATSASRSIAALFRILPGGDGATDQGVNQ